MASRLPAPKPAPAIRLSDASLFYGDTALFDGLSIDLAAGEWTVVLGPSGVGKTALLRLIANLEHTATGALTCDDGLPINDRIAYMAQQDLLLPWLTLRDNVLIGARLRRESATDSNALAGHLLDRVGLGAYAGTLPGACSGGMRQRAALVRTLMENRPVVLMDEPFSALDAITRLQLQDIAAEMLRDRTVLLITHDPLEALRLGHSVHVMTGRPAALSPPLVPDDIPPRRAETPGLMELQAVLLDRLSAAARETEA